MITVGHLAKTYGLLPSEVLARATTYDMMVTDVCSTWEQYRNNPNSAENYSPEQLAEAMSTARS